VFGTKTPITAFKG
jgi:3-oxoacyl-[acyl-carrier-protein] synthase II